MPRLTDSPSPKGLPSAITVSPRRRSSSRANLTALNFSPFFLGMILSKAMSILIWAKTGSTFINRAAGFIGQFHLDAGRPVDDVEIGQQIAVLGDDDAGAEAAAVLRPVKAQEKLLKRIARFDPAFGGDVDDAGHDLGHRFDHRIAADIGRLRPRAGGACEKRAPPPRRPPGVGGAAGKLVGFQP